jgi:hypothetical protein
MIIPFGDFWVACAYCFVAGRHVDASADVAVSTKEYASLDTCIFIVISAPNGLSGQVEDIGSLHASMSAIIPSITPRTCMNTRQHHYYAPGLHIDTAIPGSAQVKPGSRHFPVQFDLHCKFRDIFFFQ